MEIFGKKNTNVEKKKLARDRWSTSEVKDWTQNVQWKERTIYLEEDEVDEVNQEARPFEPKQVVSRAHGLEHDLFLLLCLHFLNNIV